MKSIVDQHIDPEEPLPTTRQTAACVAVPIAACGHRGPPSLDRAGGKTADVPVT